MTTNYLLVELTSKMEYEQRLKEAAQRQRLLEFLAMTRPVGGSRWLQAVRNFVNGTFVSKEQPIHAPTPAIHAETTVDTKSEHPALSFSNRFMTEEEWMQLFYMVKNRKLSVEQAAQLLIALNTA
ncbi:MAG: hypothetical protein U0175_34700 [Caldilineaceae bacterium]